MDDLTLTRMARAKAREGIALLEAATELFPDDDCFHASKLADYEKKVSELNIWIFTKSRIA